MVPGQGSPGELVTLRGQALLPNSPSSGGAGKGSLLRGGVRPAEAKEDGDSRWPGLGTGGRGWCGWKGVPRCTRSCRPATLFLVSGTLKACPLPSTCPGAAFLRSGWAGALSGSRASARAQV